MALDDAVRDEQPEAGAALAAREERLEHPVPHGRVHAGPGVADLEHGLAPLLPHRDDDRLAVVHGLERVRQEV